MDCMDRNAKKWQLFPVFWSARTRMNLCLLTWVGSTFLEYQETLPIRYDCLFESRHWIVTITHERRKGCYITIPSIEYSESLLSVYTCCTYAQWRKDVMCSPVMVCADELSFGLCVATFWLSSSTEIEAEICCISFHSQGAFIDLCIQMKCVSCNIILTHAF